MSKLYNQKMYHWVLSCTFLSVFVGLLVIVNPGIVHAKAQMQSKISIIVEEGVPEAFSNDVIKSVAYMEKFYKEKYNLVIKRPVRIVITPDKEAYTIARMREGGETREKAERHAKFASGNSFDQTNTIVLNGGHALMASSSEKRVKTTIHELTHQVQAQLSKERQSDVGHMWLSEGSANSIAFRVMEYAGFSTVEKERIDWLKNVRNPAKEIPAPEEVLYKDEWLKLMDKKYNCYGLATNMTEFLIDKSSFDHLITYYKLLKDNDKNISFKKAFGMTYDQFLADYNEYYKKEIVPVHNI